MSTHKKNAGKTEKIFLFPFKKLINAFKEKIRKKNQKYTIEMFELRKNVKHKTTFVDMHYKSQICFHQILKNIFKP